MLRWIANKLRPAPQRVRVDVLATFTREPYRDKTLRSRLIDVRPIGFPSDRRVELSVYFDDWDEWCPVAEFSIDDAEAFAALIRDAVAFDREREVALATT